MPFPNARAAVPFSGSTTSIINTPISSVVCSPNRTRLGGVLGLRGFWAELSNVQTACRTVPAGSRSGASHG